MSATSCASPDDLLTTAQVAQLVGKTVATVNRWAAEGRLKVAAQANGRLYRRADVEPFIAFFSRAAADAEATS